MSTQIPTWQPTWRLEPGPLDHEDRVFLKRAAQTLTGGGSRPKPQTEAEWFEELQDAVPRTYADKRGWS
jgi:hypothetical protein